MTPSKVGNQKDPSIKRYTWDLTLQRYGTTNHRGSTKTLRNTQFITRYNRLTKRDGLTRDHPPWGSKQDGKVRDTHTYKYPKRTKASYI